MSNDDEKKKKKSNEGLVKPSIRLLMIRHAESKNNEVYRKAHSLFKGGTPEFDIKGWNDFVDEHRSSDPGISSTGELQAEKLKEYLVPHLDNQSSHPIRLITSPMRRTMATILPTLQNLKGDASIIVNGLYFESEGCHIKDKPLPGMNQAEIKEFLSSATGSGVHVAFNSSIQSCAVYELVKVVCPSAGPVAGPGAVSKITSSHKK